jgi:hypothetical protein
MALSVWFNRAKKALSPNYYRWLPSALRKIINPTVNLDINEKKTIVVIGAGLGRIVLCGVFGT